MFVNRKITILKRLKLLKLSIGKFWNHSWLFLSFSWKIIPCKYTNTKVQLPSIKIIWFEKLGSRKNAPGKISLGKLPPGNLPPRKIAPQKIAPRKIASQEKCPQESFPPWIFFVDFLSLAFIFMIIFVHKKNLFSFN